MLEPQHREIEVKTLWAGSGLWAPQPQFPWPSLGSSLQRMPSSVGRTQPSGGRWGGLGVEGVWFRISHASESFICLTLGKSALFYRWSEAETRTIFAFSSVLFHQRGRMGVHTGCIFKRDNLSYLGVILFSFLFFLTTTEIIPVADSVIVTRQHNTGEGMKNHSKVHSTANMHLILGKKPPCPFCQPHYKPLSTMLDTKASTFFEFEKTFFLNSCWWQTTVDQFWLTFCLLFRLN